MSKLLIVESPTKEKTLSKFLGKDFKVVSTVGHFRDLPKSKLGVDIDNGFEPDYQIIEGKEKVIKEIKSCAAKADEIYLAPDPDREGEAIAWHVAGVIGEIKGGTDKKVFRVEFNEITKSAVLKAVQNPREIDQQLVNAQQARRILDRLVGYKISPILWRKVKTGLSAGRVQSVAVMLICDREQQISEFVAEEYWNLAVLLETERGDIFWAKLHRIADADFRLASQEAVSEIVAQLEGAVFKVAGLSEKEFSRKAPPPFITSTLQQEASRKMGWTGKRTMQVAQQLYEGIEIDGVTEGLITYMRTDSVRISEEGLAQARGVIAAGFPGAFLPPSPNVFKGKGQVQDAHEAIRPTLAERTPDRIRQALKPDQLKLYNLIWQRFIASQMSPARFSTLLIEIESGQYLFRASDTKTLFPGFLALYDPRSIDARKEEGDESDGDAVPALPIPAYLKEADALSANEWKPTQHFTKPLPRYNDASLIKALEEYAIGRPSTYATIVDTIIQRGYIVREKRNFVPTEWGFLVTELMRAYFAEIVDVKFTADMEEKLDLVAEGKEDWRELVGRFWTELSAELENAGTDERRFKPKPVETDQICELCGSNMLIRQGKFGKFLGCSNFPACKNTRTLEKEGATGQNGNATAVRIGEVCPDCGGELVVRVSKWGSKFVACTGFPKCKYSRELQKDCPKCGGPLEKRVLPNKRKVYVCADESGCGFKLWGNPLLERCEACGFFLAERKMKGGREAFRFCTNPECEHHTGIDM